MSLIRIPLLDGHDGRRHERGSRGCEEESFRLLSWHEKRHYSRHDRHDDCCDD